MAEALTEAYAGIFTINANPTQPDRPLIEGKFKSTHNVTDRMAQLQAMTFFALLKLADLQALREGSPQQLGTAQEDDQQEAQDEEDPTSTLRAPRPTSGSLEAPLQYRGPFASEQRRRGVQRHLQIPARTPPCRLNQS